MRRALWLLAVVVVVLAGVGIYVAFGRPGKRLPLQLPVGKGCQVTTSGGTVSLYPDQMANAATIAAVGLRMNVPDRGIVVALATAMQESELINLSGGDLDSVGLFQQRPSMGWGSAAQLLDPRYASTAFYTKLLTVSGWDQMRITDAAQAVQRSAYPDAYDKWASDAQVIGDALTGTQATAVTCIKVGEPNLRGDAAAKDLSDGLHADWGDYVGTTVAGTDVTAGPGDLTLVTTEDRAGWQLAHWLVAHSVDHNVSRVLFQDQEWTAASGAWSRVNGQATDSAHVVAAVYAS
jgi:hypothetical protein